jgi:hypothetical protein
MADSFDELRALQLRFQAYLEGHSEDFENDVISTEDALAEHRLAAYYNAYRIRLIDCLATDFPVLRKTIGEEEFEYLVLDYLKRYPSHHPSVRWVGKHMAEFLGASDRDNHEFLSELAAFEWGQGLCFDAGECGALFTLEDMANITPGLWPKITLQFHPSLRWLDLQWNAPPYWVALDKDEDENERPQPQREEIPTRWLMWRKELKPNWRSLDVAEAWAIEAAVDGADFAALCEGLLEWIGEDAVAMSAAGYLKQWIADELVCSVKTVNR